MAQSASKSCDICMSGPGRNYCQQCDQWMCGSCKTLHLRSKISRNHCFLSESKCGPKDKPLCKEHDENFIFYCIDCEIPICKMCIVKKHKKHDTSEINESTQELQDDVKNLLDSAIKSLKTNLDKIEQGTEKYKSDIKEAIRSITEDGKQIKQWIDQKVRALITSLEEKETENLKTIHLIRTGLKDDLDKFQKSHFAFTETQKIADATKLLNQFKRLQFDLDVSGERKSPVIPTIKYNKKNISEREIFTLFGDISSQETVCYMETTQEKKTRQHSRGTINRYQCFNCWEEVFATKKPIHYCGKCGQRAWFECTRDN